MTKDVRIQQKKLLQFCELTLFPDNLTNSMEEAPVARSEGTLVMNELHLCQARQRHTFDKLKMIFMMKGSVLTNLQCFHGADD